MSHDDCDIRTYAIHGTGAEHDGEISVVTQLKFCMSVRECSDFSVAEKVRQKGKTFKTFHGYRQWRRRSNLWESLWSV